VASKSPANFKPKPLLILSTDIPKFDAIAPSFPFSDGLLDLAEFFLNPPVLLFFAFCFQVCITA
jgi:hypothetical protein